MFQHQKRRFKTMVENKRYIFTILALEIEKTQKKWRILGYFSAVFAAVFNRITRKTLQYFSAVAVWKIVRAV